MSAQNIEKMVMQENTDKLIKGLRHTKDSVCRKLCGKGLISFKIHQDSLEGKSGIDFIISTLQDRVENDSGAYYKYFEVLENDSALEYLKRWLEKDRLSKVSQSSSGTKLDFEENALQTRIPGSPVLALPGPICANNHELQFKEYLSLSTCPCLLVATL